MSKCGCIFLVHVSKGRSVMIKDLRSAKQVSSSSQNVYFL